MKRTHGFSLFELMIVIAIATLLITICAVNSRFLRSCTMQTQLDLFITTCTYLAHTAIATKTPQTLILDNNEQSYSFNNQKHTLPRGIQFGILDNIKGPPATPTHVVQSPITFTNNTITFWPDGIISSGTVYLLDTATHALYAISSGVGHVSFLRKYRYDGRWHLV
jgi:prepilin-type N-terminal cleavage/methylation domain-containing protein